MTANDRPRELDVEAMIRECVPGGTSCDPQAVADGIRAYFAMLLSVTPIASEHPIPSEPDALTEHLYGAGEAPREQAMRQIFEAIGRWSVVAPQGLTREFVAAVESAIDALAASQTGVPREPTEAMLSAAMRAKPGLAHVWRAMYDAAPSQPEARQEGLTEFAEHRSWELSWGTRDDDECAPVGWRVHRCHGSVNDREWTLIGFGETPLIAVRAALARHPKGA